MAPSAAPTQPGSAAPGRTTGAPAPRTPQPCSIRERTTHAPQRSPDPRRPSRYRKHDHRTHLASQAIRTRPPRTPNRPAPILQPQVRHFRSLFSRSSRNLRANRHGPHPHPRGCSCCLPRRVAFPFRRGTYVTTRKCVPDGGNGATGSGQVIPASPTLTPASNPLMYPSMKPASSSARTEGRLTNQATHESRMDSEFAKRLAKIIRVAFSAKTCAGVLGGGSG